MDCWNASGEQRDPVPVLEHGDPPPTVQLMDVMGQGAPSHVQIGLQLGFVDAWPSLNRGHDDVAATRTFLGGNHGDELAMCY